MKELEFHQIMIAIREMNFCSVDNIKCISYEGVYNILRSHLEEGIFAPVLQENKEQE